MTPLVLAPQPITRTADHVYGYYPPDGEPILGLPSVTSILRVLDKSDGLVPWAARQTAEASLRMFSDGSLASLLNAVGNEGAIKALTDRHRWQRDEAAQLGSEVHRLAEDPNATHLAADLSPAIGTRVMAYRDWWRNSGWTKPLTEVIGVNPSVGYGGTADMYARDADGRLVLADIKTGKGVYRESILQLAAYGRFTVVMIDGKLHAAPDPDRYVILHVTLDGVREIELTVGQDEHMAFADCVDLHRWMQTVKGRL